MSNHSPSNAPLHAAASAEKRPTAETASTSPAGRRPPLPEGIFCPDCGYDLRGLTGERCPECGFDLITVRAHRSQIPWLYRSDLGRFQAYWKTVWFVTARSRQFHHEVLRPLDPDEARRFRWLTILHAYVPVGIGSAAALTVYWSPISGFFGLYTLPAWVALQLACLSWLIVATLLPRLFLQVRFWPIEKQERAIVLGDYACATLSWTGPLAVLLMGVSPLLVSGVDPQLPYLRFGALVATTLTIALAFFGWWSSLLRLLRGALRAGLVHRAMTAVCLPLLWGITGALHLVLVGVGFLYMVIAVTEIIRTSP